MAWRRRRANHLERAVEQHPSTRPVAPTAAFPQHESNLLEGGLFAFLEDSLQGAVPTAPLGEHAAAVTRTLELANADWPERDAARELLLLVDGERRVLERTHRVLQGGLLRSMLPNPVAIRASRIVHAALKQARSDRRW